jgi:hypothetical protein
MIKPATYPRTFDKHTFTHYARFRGVPCYWDERDGCLCGRNRFWQLLFDGYAVPLDTFIGAAASALFPDYEPGFAIRLEGEIDHDG